jgi:predicted adenine nucleotide alpha hydrolase (AANH) superfamily ATPase
VQILREEGHKIKRLYYNPNIHPYEEFEKRKANLQILSEREGFDVIYLDDFDQDRWENFQGDISERCTMCYTTRFYKVGEIARDHGFDAFTTTLLVSPYQNHELIVDICNKVSDKYGVHFYYKDFRPGFRQGQAGAREMGLYRQKYCGCIKSREYK